jgi:hypothetical protein
LPVAVLPRFEEAEQPSSIYKGIRGAEFQKFFSAALEPALRLMMSDRLVIREIEGAEFGSPRPVRDRHISRSFRR